MYQTYLSFNKFEEFFFAKFPEPMKSDYVRMFMHSEQNNNGDHGINLIFVFKDNAEAHVEWLMQWDLTKYGFNDWGTTNVMEEDLELSESSE